LKLSLYPIIGTPELAQGHLFSPDIPPEKMQAYFHRIQDESYRAFLDMLFLNLPRPKRVATPMLVLGATKDNIFTAGEVKATAHAYNAKVEFFPMAHDMMLEAGWQSVADTILSWLAEQDV
jgi:alpha-beta hydrolase superfamily lysophospholipase